MGFTTVLTTVDWINRCFPLEDIKMGHHIADSVLLCQQD